MLDDKNNTFVTINKEEMLVLLSMQRMESKGRKTRMFALTVFRIEIKMKSLEDHAFKN